MLFNKNMKITPLQEEYVLNFDGCSKGNPGIGGAGAVLYHNGNEIWSSSKYVGDNVTNNYAEYFGLLIGLKEALIRKIKKLVVKGDSQLVIKQMIGEYKVKSSNLISLYNNAKEMELLFDEILFNHVYRNENKRADYLSNVALTTI